MTDTTEGPDGFTNYELGINDDVQFFRRKHIAHLPPEAVEAAEPFRELALHLVRHLPTNPQMGVTIQKLLEARDAAIRSAMAERHPVGVSMTG